MYTRADEAYRACVQESSAAHVSARAALSQSKPIVAEEKGPKTDPRAAARGPCFPRNRSALERH